MPAEDGDIDSFIRQQKAKLANERQALNNRDKMLSEYDQIWKEQHGGGGQRRQWGEPQNVNPPSYQDNRPRPTERRKEKEDLEYERQWEARHPGQDTSPRFRDDRLHMAQPEQGYQGFWSRKQQEDEEYYKIWDDTHQGAPYSQAQPKMPAQTQEPYFDTEKLIRDTVQKRRDEEEAQRRANQAPPQRGPPRGAPTLRGRQDSQESEYTKLWEQQHKQRGDPSNSSRLHFSDSRQNIDYKIAEAKRDAEEYHKRWDQQHQKPSITTPERFGIHKAPDEAEDFGLFHSLGQEDKRRKLIKGQENKLNMKGENVVDLTPRRGYHPNSLREQTDDHKASALLNNQSDAAKLERMKERNNEYREFLAKKNEKDQHRFDDKKHPQYNQAPADTGVYATLPGLRYSNSAQKNREKMEERNKEYNELMRQKRQRGAGPAGVPPTAPKQGWGTPTPSYEQMLEKKREQEAGFRRANDPGFQSDRNSKENDPYSVARGSPIAHAASRRPPNQTDGQYFGTSLPLGGNTQSEEQRKKAEYARELRQQMEADKNARKIERREGALVNNTGNTLYNPTVSTRTPRHDTSVKPYHTEIYGQLQEMDKISPRNKRRPAPGGIGGLNLGRQETNSGGIGGYGGGYNPSSGADLGLDLSILQRPTLSTLDPPAGLQYQPSTFITANAVPALNNSVDEAYNFYAGMNPLDPNQTAPAAPPPGRGRVGDDVPSLNLSGFGGDDQGAHSRVRFKDNRTPAVGMEFPTDDDRKVEKKQNVNAYREELERQIQERNAKKRREKEEQERYDLKMEEEARHYDPFGKGGGGAPMRDPDGNVISDLRQIRHDNNDPNSQRSRQRDYSPRGYGGGGGGFGGGYGGFSEPAPAAGNTSRAANSYRDDLIGPPPTQTTADGDPSFARGGHGIFGMPKTEGEKNQADKYKMDLKRQIEEKKQEELRKKEKERQEEEREQRILEEQRQRIQREYEEEQRKAKAKEEEARMKNEEMMRLAEDKKKELERQRKEAEEKRQQELREQRERELRERQAIASPPVPATRTRTAEPEPQPQPQPHSTRRDPPRAQSADVLNQLADMRAQLRKERQRVQHMLEDQEDDVEIYDPRQVHRPPPAPIVSHKPEIDVFETAMNRNAVAVRRTPGDRANPQAVEDFNALKHKNDSDSRKQFRQMFPNEPDSNDALETQQLALLRQQEERLNNMKDRRALEDTSALRLGRDIRSSSSQLHSNSAFVDVNGVADFPDDFEDMPKRNESARAARRRARAPSSPRVDRYATPDFNSRQTFGSQTSLNVDKLAKKNEDRLRRLRDMQGDDLSLYDPDDVLDRFMTKQGHNRRTYDDDFDSRSESFTPAFVTPVT